MSWLFKLLKKIWNFIKKYFWIILLIILIVIIVFFPYLLPVIWGWLTTAWGWITSLYGVIGWQGMAILGLGLYAAVDPEGASELVADVVEVVADVVGSVVTGVGTGLLRSPIVIGGLLLGAYWLFFRDKDEDGKSNYRTLVDRNKKTPNASEKPA